MNDNIVTKDGSAVTVNTATIKELANEQKKALNETLALLSSRNLSKEEHEKLWTEAYDKAVALLDYRVKMGKLILETEGAQGQRSDLACEQSKVKMSKEDVYTELGLSRTQSDDYQKIAKNPSAVEKAKVEARKEKCLPTVYLVKKLIAETEQVSTEGNGTTKTSKAVKKPSVSANTIYHLDIPENSNVSEYINKALSDLKLSDKKTYICLEVPSDKIEEQVKAIIDGGFITKQQVSIGISKPKVAVGSDQSRKTNSKLYTGNKENLILGAIAGDIIGSVFESKNRKNKNIKTTDFDLFCKKSKFTDDSVMTLATMDVILQRKSYTETYHSLGNNYSKRRGFGKKFLKWIKSKNPQPYNSCGNGSAMRVSPIGWCCNSIEEVMSEAKKSAEVSHNHPESIKGAQATAIAVYMARTGESKSKIKEYIVKEFGYNLERTLDDIRPDYKFTSKCEDSVPEAIIAFLESKDYEDAIRLAISLGGDSDTQACIAGSIAEAFYQKMPNDIIENVLKILPEELIKIVEEFSAKYRLIKEKNN